MPSWSVLRGNRASSRLILDQVLSEEPLGPEDETADMMIEEIYRWRREERDRNLP